MHFQQLISPIAPILSTVANLAIADEPTVKAPPARSIPGAVPSPQLSPEMWPDSNWR